MRSVLTLLVIGTLISQPVMTPSNTALEQPVNVQEMTYPAKNISVSINRSADEVYQFASRPENFPKWIAFIKSVTKQGQVWLAKTEIGDLKIKFSPQNEFGILDHQVTFANGVTVSNPMRAVPNNKGCEFIFTLFRMPDKTDEEFNEDANAVARDLQKLKDLLEH